ncbi:FecCD family ABC transporter permease [Deferribacter abyssi]|uniref:FecCD family ABC transporter permease n=1 Tax=Deferribacter abyssi TaxID=213806 RepID=UPI003C1CD499
MRRTLVTLFLTVVIVIFALTNGAVKLNDMNLNLMLNIRLPRVLMAFLVGAMLAQSGSLLQLLLRNPLADGFTTGISSAAALGAVIAITLGFNYFFIPFVSLFFATLGLMIVFKVGSSDKSFHFTTIILAGIVLNIICSSFISFLKYYFNDSIGTVVFWLMGGFYGVTYSKITILAFVTIVLFFLSYKSAYKLNILAFDDLTANSLGVNVKRMRKKFFVVAAMLTAVAVSFSGIIGFVGLIVPHIVRGIFGGDMKTNILYSTLFGANFLLFADTISRIIIPSGAELPVGVVTSFLGGLFFIFLLKYKLKRVWY